MGRLELAFIGDVLQMSTELLCRIQLLPYCCKSNVCFVVMEIRVYAGAVVLCLQKEASSIGSILSHLIGEFCSQLAVRYS